jgi:hypothetical protein
MSTHSNNLFLMNLIKELMERSSERILILKDPTSLQYDQTILEIQAITDRVNQLLAGMILVPPTMVRDLHLV